MTTFYPLRGLRWHIRDVPRGIFKLCLIQQILRGKLSWIRGGCYILFYNPCGTSDFIESKSPTWHLDFKFYPSLTKWMLVPGSMFPGWHDEAVWSLGKFPASLGMSLAQVTHSAQSWWKFLWITISTARVAWARVTTDSLPSLRHLHFIQPRSPGQEI